MTTATQCCEWGKKFVFLNIFDKESHKIEQIPQKVPVLLKVFQNAKVSSVLKFGDSEKPTKL